MPLFACANCLCVENTAACNYYEQVLDSRPLCSECDPSIGLWHGKFEKKSAKGMFIDSQGHLHKQEPTHTKTLGVVL